MGLGRLLVLPRFFFLGPLTLERGTVGPMEGRANAVDFYDDEGFGSNGNQNQVPHKHEGEGNHTHILFSWTDVNPYAAFIYAFGDVNCHQKHERSWQVNENQLPVCTRDVGIFFGLFMGGVIFSRRGVESMDGARHLPFPVA